MAMGELKSPRSLGSVTVIYALRAYILACPLIFGFASTLTDPLELEAQALEARIDQAARAVDDDPRLQNLSHAERRALAQFVAGNMFFVLLHEMGHVHITEMGLPVLGREEDAADSFATVTMLKVGAAVTHRMLVEAAKGWFLSARRNQKEGITEAFYDEHELDSQRAYWIVCLMVGSDPEKFKDLAEETGLPESRRQTCVGDYSNASWSWDQVLEPHRRTPDKPKTTISVVYGPDKDKLEVYARAFRSVRLLETVAERASEQWIWRAPLSLEMQSCGAPGSRWDLPTRKLTLCYEMAADFAQLYRNYADDPELPRFKSR